MFSKHPHYRNVLAIFIGIILMVIPNIEPFPFILGLLYFTCGAIFGFFWPKKSWRWGLWIAGPLLLLMLFSIAFAGLPKVFIQDIMVIIVPIIAASFGGFAGAWFKYREIKRGVFNR